MILQDHVGASLLITSEQEFEHTATKNAVEMNLLL